MAVTTNVKNFLKNKHITVPDEWITACVEWVQSENPGLNVRFPVIESPLSVLLFVIHI